MNKEIEKQEELPFGLKQSDIREMILDEMRRQGHTEYKDLDGVMKPL